MPEEEQQAEQAQEQPQETVVEPEKKSGGLMQWLIPAVVVVVFVSVGFVVGRLLGKGPAVAEAEPVEQIEQDEPLDLLLEKAAGAKGWYYETLDAVATNLNEPGSTRYVRAALTLEMMPNVDEVKATQFLDDRKPIMINLLNIYFAGLTLEDLNSDKDMRRIQAELLDVFNESLFPDGKPMIKSILFKEFGVQ